LAADAAVLSVTLKVSQYNSWYGGYGQYMWPKFLDRAFLPSSPSAAVLTLCMPNWTSLVGECLDHFSSKNILGTAVYLKPKLVRRCAMLYSWEVDTYAIFWYDCFKKGNIQ